ncbi:MAG: hypothetical protein ACFE8N_06280 [Promethearchaeota archaeon]
MMDSEIKELRKRKIKRILLWVVGASAIIALILVIFLIGPTTGGT